MGFAQPNWYRYFKFFKELSLSMQEMKVYYNQRAQEYERVYQIEDRQDDIKTLGIELQKRMSNRDVLEVACGTGFWTKITATVARSILASDQSVETLEIARSKTFHREVVQFVQDDAYKLSRAEGTFNAAFAGFWWSHIPKNLITVFLVNLHQKLLPGSKVIFFDNQYIEGNSTLISRTDSDGNTYQIRKLLDGSSHEILKNFPVNKELEESLMGVSKNLKIHHFKYYWMIEYETY